MSSDYIFQRLVRFNHLSAEVYTLTQEIAKAVNGDKADMPDVKPSISNCPSPSLAENGDRTRHQVAGVNTVEVESDPDITKKLKALCTTLSKISKVNEEVVGFFLVFHSELEIAENSSNSFHTLNPQPIDPQNTNGDAFHYSTSQATIPGPSTNMVTNNDPANLSFLPGGNFPIPLALPYDNIMMQPQYADPVVFYNQPDPSFDPLALGNQNMMLSADQAVTHAAPPRRRFVPNIGKQQRPARMPVFDAASQPGPTTATGATANAGAAAKLAQGALAGGEDANWSSSGGSTPTGTKTASPATPSTPATSAAATPTPGTGAGANVGSPRARVMEYIPNHECVARHPADGRWLVLECPECHGNGKFKGSEWQFLQGPKGFQEHLRLVHSIAPAEKRGRRPRGWAFVFDRCVLRPAERRDVLCDDPGFAENRQCIMSRVEADAAAAAAAGGNGAPAAVVPAAARSGTKRAAPMGQLDNGVKGSGGIEDDGGADEDADGDGGAEQTQLGRIVCGAKKRARFLVATGGGDGLLGDGKLSFLEDAVKLHEAEQNASVKMPPVQGGAVDDGLDDSFGEDFSLDLELINPELLDLKSPNL